MADAGRPAAAASVITATVCAFAMIATQVAGKATRDALFLTNFDISALPLVLTVSALLSLGAVLVTARSMSIFGPQRVVPPLFLASGLLLLAEWALALRDVRVASVIVYLHIAVLGSILISGFWSIINEAFDPRSARRTIARVVGGATLGGLFGGFLADRIGAWLGVLTVLPVIAALHGVCAFLLPRLVSAYGAGRPFSMRALWSNPPEAGDKTRAESGFQVLRRVSYIRNLALIVLLGNIAATFVDFLFKARAMTSYPDSTELVRFFAIFYTAVSLGTLLVQMGITRQLLERVGIANTMAVRPAVMTVGGILTMPWMGLAGLGVLRGVEAVAQSSLFRSGYELLYTPVVPDEKRRTKTLVDVGADRLGDALGGLATRLVILLPAAVSGRVLLGLAVAVSLAGFAVARALRRGYIQALEASLIDRAQRLDIRRDDAGFARTMMMESVAGIDLSMSIDGIDLSSLRASPATPAAAADPADTLDAAPVRPAPARTLDPEVAALVEMRSGDPIRIRATLQRTRTLSPALAAQAVSLLAWDEVTGWASRALAKSAPAITGQLVDRLLDPNEDFAIRRRVPRILSMCLTQRAFDGLMGALGDGRFEVRYQSARALARIHDQLPSIVVDAEAVYRSVLRETGVDRALWSSQRILDEPQADGTPSPIDEALRSRATRSLEHVFTLLSLVLPRQPLRIAFKGLLTEDALLRGTSLEYLESVLPRGTWEALRPFLHDTRETPAPARPSTEILESLMRSSPSIEIKLEELRSRSAEAGE